MKKITYNPRGINNFHNADPIRILVSTIVDPDTPAPLYLITRRQAERIARHFCGVKECRCPAGGVQQMDPDGTEYAIPVKWCE
jgi:hypothetical protein